MLRNKAISALTILAIYISGISFMRFRPYLVTLGRTAIFISLSMMKLLASQARPPVHRYMSPQLSSTEHNSVVREIQHSISNTDESIILYTSLNISTLQRLQIFDPTLLPWL